MASVSIGDVLNLSIEERIRLVEDIWDSIAEVPESVELTEAQRTELDRRIEARQNNPDAGSPWLEVKARVLARR